MLLSSREKILLHLYQQSRNIPLPARVMPSSLSQEGISGTTGVARKHIPRNLKALMEKGLVKEDKAHIKGAPQRRKVYFPTPEGRDEALAIRDKVLSAPVILRAGEMEEELVLEKAIKEFTTSHREVGEPELLFILRFLIEDGRKEVLDEQRLLSALISGERHIKHLSGAPVLRQFFGREREKEEILDLMKERRMVVVYGITGIGKSAFGSQLARNYHGSVFWYSFHEWDTLQNLLRPLGRFLEEMGRGGSGLKDGDLDITEALGILREGLSGSEALIVLDDMQKASQEFTPLFKGIVESLDGMEDVDFLILSRKIPYYYSRRDVAVKRTIGEYLLQGLDRESCLALLHARGIPEEAFKEIYDITCGHPLSLELIETPGPGIDAGNLEVYFEEEILRRLPLSEKRILQQASVYRYPVPSDALLVQPGQDYENISNLFRNALILQTADGNYLVHDLLKGFVSSRLSPSQRMDNHHLAAEFYLSLDWERSCIEAIYHLLEAGEEEQAVRVILERGREIIFRGYGKELHEHIGGLDDRALSGKEMADLLTLHAEIDTVMGDWTGAEGHLTEALELYRGLEIRDGMALVLKNLGGLRLRKGEAEEAVMVLLESLSFYQELEDLMGISKIQNNIGLAHLQKGEIEKAKEALEQSLEISERTGEAQGIARAITNLGIIEFQHGDLDRAVEYYNRALDLSEKLGDRKTLAQLYDNLGEAYRLKGDKEKALDFFDRGIELAEAHGFRLITAQLCKDMSQILEGEEREYYRSLAREICQELGIKEEV